MKRVNKAAKLFVYMIILMLYINFGPSEEHHSVPLDGSSLYGENQTEPADIIEAEPLLYTRKEVVIKNEPQVVHVLELDLRIEKLEVFPVLAQDRIFGFELLSEMKQRHHGTAIINGGFNFAYGQPSGLVIQNGKLLSGSLGYGRILLLKDQKAWFQKPPLSIRVEGDTLSLPVDRINPYPAEKGILIFTPEFDLTNRLEVPSTTCVVENGKVVSIGRINGETDIPRNGLLIVDLRITGSPLEKLIPGEKITLSWEGMAEQGYQCSGSLVENGVNVAKDDDPWAGNLRIPTPRTAVGIKDENTLVFMVVDGRQPGYSSGVTGKQLADLLVADGVTEAAILDGGASSEMIYQNEIVNRPSTGKERLLASAFIVRLTDEPSP